MKNTKRNPQVTLTVIFTLIVFIILTLTMIIVSFIGYLLLQSGWIDVGKTGKTGISIMISVFASSSLIIGTAVSAFVGHIPLKHIKILIDGLNKLASGYYETRINPGKSKVGVELAESFNTLASELQNTEMLRSDFINSFSHEFRTPIVSIRGFARILRKGNITAVQQDEYLSIIEEESERLTAMASNILNLSKVENQTILTNVTVFNLSEQLRKCILLLEKEWNEKNIDIVADFGEYEVSANEELLKQIWINLLDNAVKFSPIEGKVEISINQNSNWISVSIKNSGPEISKEQEKKIFNKFFQCDKSRSTGGNGIGLAIVKRVADLHNGKISVISKNGNNIFTVELPINR